MTNWRTLTNIPSALQLIVYGKGDNERCALRIQRCYSKSKYFANRRGIEFELSPADYAALWRDECELCLTLFSDQTRESLRSLDRIDPAEGYKASNVRFVCYACNTRRALDDIAKGTYTRRKKKVEEPCL